MIDGLHLLRPDALWLLLLCPAIALALWYRKLQQGDWAKVIDADLLAHLVPDSSRRARRPQVWLPVALSALLVLAITGPSLKQVELPVIKRADALVIVLDLSASMLAADIQPSRVQRAQQKILDLLDRRVEGVTGLVVFAGDAHVVTPLTDDTRTIANLMPALSPTMMPLPGANATAGIELATELLVTAGAQGGHILLISDGLPNFRATEARDALAASGATLAILAMGTSSGAPIPLPNGGFLKDNDGEIVIPTLDMTEIARIASELNAQQMEVRLDDRDIDYLTERELTGTDGELDLDRQTDAWQDQGFWIAAALALLLLPAFRKGVLASALLLLFIPGEAPRAASWDDLWLTDDQQGARLLAEGNAEAAAQQFSDPTWRGMAHYDAGAYDQAANLFATQQSADALFNQGNALALQGELEAALEAFEQTLLLEPEAEDAKANRDFILSLLNQQEQEPQDQEGQDQEQQGDQSEQDSQSDSEGGEQSEEDGEHSDTSEKANENDSSASGDEQQDPSQSADSQSEPSEAMADAERTSEEQLEAATAEQMAKFDEALEEQQALEQWLRRVPDDPGGLLRRKFRYQTMQRLREGEEPDETVRW
jgi:Ca-activated chloride channel family protein